MMKPARFLQKPRFFAAQLGSFAGSSLAPALALAILLSAPLSTPAQANINDTGSSNGCPDFPKPSVRLTTYFEPARYNFTQTLGKLRQMAETQAAVLFHQDQPVGLALGELNFHMVMKMNAAFGADGRVCARPAEMQVDVGFRNNTVYVARELPRRSCGHTEILAHEEGHVAIDRELLRDYKPLLERFAQLAIKQMGVIRAANPQAAEVEMQNFLNRQLEIAAAQMNKERVKRQSEHDNPAEYKRLTQMCDGEIAKVVAANSPAALREMRRAGSRNSVMPSRSRLESN